MLKGIGINWENKGTWNYKEFGIYDPILTHSLTQTDLNKNYYRFKWKQKNTFIVTSELKIVYLILNSKIN